MYFVKAVVFARARVCVMERMAFRYKNKTVYSVCSCYIICLGWIHNGIERQLRLVPVSAGKSSFCT